MTAKAPINVRQFSRTENFILRENFRKMLYSMIFLFFVILNKLKMIEVNWTQFYGTSIIKYTFVDLKILQWELRDIFEFLKIPMFISF